MENTKKQTEYIRAIGRRKTSTAVVKLFKNGTSTFTINDKKSSEYFPTDELQKIIHEPVAKTKVAEKYDIVVTAKGGGIHSQAEAVRHGIARILASMDEELKTTVKKLGFLKRDPRAKERRKFGLKKARKSPQWSKR
jgi:small subunit ribosomal protein S9